MFSVLHIDDDFVVLLSVYIPAGSREDGRIRGHNVYLVEVVPVSGELELWRRIVWRVDVAVVVAAAIIVDLVDADVVIAVRIIAVRGIDF